MVIYKLVPLFFSALCAQDLSIDHSTSSDRPVEIEADRTIVCNEHQGQCTAIGNAVAIRGDFRVNADKLVLHFITVNKKQEATHITAHGHVVMSTLTEKAYGDYANYDLGLDRLKLTGSNLKLVTPKETLQARDSLEYWRGTQQGFAHGDAVGLFPEKKQLLKADKLVAYFRTVPGQTNKDKQELDHIDAIGQVLVSSPEEIVTGDTGTYHADGKLAEIKDNVTITRGDNQIHGGYATFNMKTNVAQMYGGKPGEKGSQRIHGLINPKDAKKVRGSSLVKKSDT